MTGWGIGKSLGTKSVAIAGFVGDRLHKMTDSEFEEHHRLKDIYKFQIHAFVSHCGVDIGVQYLKEVVQRIPKKLSGGL